MDYAPGPKCVGALCCICFREISYGPLFYDSIVKIFTIIVSTDVNKNFDGQTHYLLTKGEKRVLYEFENNINWKRC